MLWGGATDLLSSASHSLRRLARLTGENPISDKAELESSRGSPGIYSIQNQRIRPLVFCFLIAVCLPLFILFSFLLFFPIFAFSFFSFFFYSFSFLFFFLSQFNLFLATMHWAKWLEGKPHFKRIRNIPLSHRVLQNLDYNSMSESNFRSTIIKLLVARDKKHKGLKRLHDCRI